MIRNVKRVLACVGVPMIGYLMSIGTLYTSSLVQAHKSSPSLLIPIFIGVGLAQGVWTLTAYRRSAMPKGHQWLGIGFMYGLFLVLAVTNHFDPTQMRGYVGFPVIGALSVLPTGANVQVSAKEPSRPLAD